MHSSDDDSTYQSLRSDKTADEWVQAARAEQDIGRQVDELFEVDGWS